RKDASNDSRDHCTIRNMVPIHFSIACPIELDGSCPGHSCSSFLISCQSNKNGRQPQRLVGISPPRNAHLKPKLQMGLEFPFRSFLATLLLVRASPAHNRGWQEPLRRRMHVDAKRCVPIGLWTFPEHSTIQ